MKKNHNTETTIEEGIVLNAFSRALGREAHILTQNPDLLWQQLYNNLQWYTCSDENDLFLQVLTIEVNVRMTSPKEPWLHKKKMTDEANLCVFTLIGHKSKVISCNYSPDGKTIATLSSDGELKNWNLKTGDELPSITCKITKNKKSAFSPDGKLKALVSSSVEGFVELLETKNGECLGKLSDHTNTVIACSFSPDGRRLVTASADETVIIWDIESRQKIHTYYPHERFVLDCVFSPDGKKVATANWDKTLALIDTDNNSIIKIYKGHTEPVNECAFSPDGKTLLSASFDHSAKVWDIGVVPYKHEQMTLSGVRNHAGAVIYCSFLPGGKYILSIGMDDVHRWWKVDTGQQSHAFEFTTKSRHFAISPDGEEIFSVSENDIVSKSGKIKLHGHTGQVSSCVYSPNGKRILSASFDKTLILWNSENGKYIVKYEGHQGRVLCCVFSPNGDTILSGGSDKKLILWNKDTGEMEYVFKGHRSSIISCVISPDGMLAASGDAQGKIIIWNLKNKESNTCYNTLKNTNNNLTI